MGTFTPILNLFKPNGQDQVRVTQDLAENFDKIDAHAHSGTYAPLTHTRVAADTGAAPLEWTHNGDENFLFHLTTGLAYSAALSSGAALIGIGIGDGDGSTKNELGIGILFSNKKSGEAMRLSNNSTITSATAYGLHGLQASMAPLVFLESTADSVADLLTIVCQSGSPAAGQVMQRWSSIGGGGVAGFANDCGRVYAANGRLDWFREIRANGSMVLAHTADVNNSPIATLQTSVSMLAPFEVRHRQYSGSPGVFWNTRFVHSPAGYTNNHLLGALQASQSGGSTYGAETWSSNIVFDGTRLGFYGAEPVVKPTSTTDLRTALINLGLYTTGGATPLDLNGGAIDGGAA